jgi:2-phosphosulfolactate phosphatase
LVSPLTGASGRRPQCRRHVGGDVRADEAEDGGERDEPGIGPGSGGGAGSGGGGDAVGRRAASADRPWSLSPAALRRAPFTPRLVLPSPNGSAICASAAPGGGEAMVIAGCLRNAAAVGRFLHERGLPGERGAVGTVAVVAAGERWPDGSLRPALEDLLGAGAVIAALVACGGRVLSPEAEAARACFEGTADIAGAVASSVSGRELADGGFGEEVAIAVESGSCSLVPVLADGAFTAVGGSG